MASLKTGRTPLGRRAGRGLVALVLAMLVMGDATGAAARPLERDCVHPDRGSLNEFFGIGHRIVTDFCPTALVGERWTPPAFWVTNTTYDVIPEGYTPSAATPIDDFNAKFVGARYVIDAGTKHERIYSFSAAQVLHTGYTVPGTDHPLSAVLPVLRPLPPGPHTVDILWTLRADHWDGFGDDPSTNLFPAGEIHCSHIEFTVVERHDGSNT